MYRGLVIVAVAAALAQPIERAHAQPRNQVTGPTLMATTDPTPVDVVIGKHKFRVPMNYFRHPPRLDGQPDVAMLLRVLLPDMEPMTVANRHIFAGGPDMIQEIRRVANIIVKLDTVAVSSRTRLERSLWMAGRDKSVTHFSPPTPDTLGLWHLPGKPLPSSKIVDREPDLFYGNDDEGQFIGLICDLNTLTTTGGCHLFFDWNDLRIEISFLRERRENWRQATRNTKSLLARLYEGHD